MTNNYPLNQDKYFANETFRDENIFSLGECYTNWYNSEERTNYR